MPVSIEDKPWRPGDTPQWGRGGDWHQAVAPTSGQFWQMQSTGLWAPHTLVAADIAALSPSFTNLSVSGWARVGSLVAPTNTTAGHTTAAAIWVPDQTASSFTGLVNIYSNSDAPLVIRLDSLATTGVRIQGAGREPLLSGLRSGGSIASPSAVLANNTLLSLVGSGFYDSSNAALTKAIFALMANENWSSTANGTRAELGLTPTGSTTRATQHVWTPGGYDTTGYVDADVGFRVNGAAASNAILRGDGTNFVSASTIDHNSLTNRTRVIDFDLGAGFLSAGTGAISYSSGVRVSFVDAEEGQRDWATITPIDYVAAGTLKILWETPATGVKNARFRLLTGQSGDGEAVSVLNKLDSTFDAPIDGTANQMQLSQVALSSGLVGTEKRLSVSVIRQGNHANDTVGDVVYLRAVWLEYTADS